MKHRITIERLIEIVEGDRELVLVLVEKGLIEQDEHGFEAKDVDRALASRTLTREFNVNWPGVDIILRLREEIAHARRRIAELEGGDDQKEG